VLRLKTPVTFTVYGLKPNKSYIFQVGGVNVKCKGEYSKSYPITTLGGVPDKPSQPNHFKINPENPSQASLEYMNCSLKNKQMVSLLTNYSFR